jgi:hypothetical protein
MRLIKSLFVDSESRDANQTNSRFSIYFEPIECQAYFVKHVSYPNTLYSFQSNRRRFYFYITGSPNIQYVEFPINKVYDSDTFVVDFDILMKAINANFSVSFSHTTGKLTIQNLVTTFKVATTTSDPTLVEKSALTKIGFHENHAFSYVNTQEAEHILKLYATRYIYLSCPALGEDISEHSTGRINNIICRLAMIHSSFGSYNTYETNSFGGDVVVFPNNRKKFIEELQFFFLNDYGERIDDVSPYGTNGCEVSIQINFYD